MYTLYNQWPPISEHVDGRRTERVAVVKKDWRKYYLINSFDMPELRIRAR